jgi:hypothetical protein
MKKMTDPNRSSSRQKLVKSGVGSRDALADRNGTALTVEGLAAMGVGEPGIATPGSLGISC